jgi:solute carrier family 25 iron transporter 28/37
MGDEDWDPSELNFLSHMFAGSLAGLAEHVAIFPIDTLKTHVQCERCGTSSWKCATKIIRREGVFRLWRGVSATFAGCIPGEFHYIIKL